MRRPAALVLVACAAALAACTVTVGDRSGPPGGSSTASTPSRSAEPERLPEGTSAREAMAELCDVPREFGGAPAGPLTTPPAVAEVEDEVEHVRELQYDHDVGVNAVSRQEMNRKLDRAFDDQYVDDSLERRTLAWKALGVLSPDEDLRDGLHKFQAGQIVGYYNPVDGELVVISDGDVSDLSLNERFVLAHELTHAIDDQNFDLSRLDDIAKTCDDERFSAAIGAVEGSAQYFAAAVLAEFPDADLGDLAEIVQQLISSEGGAPVNVPPFLVAMQLWPYTDGLSFVSQIDEESGTAGVDQALTRLPVSTEQILHPEDYPDERPVRVDVPQLAPALSGRWRDLDVMTIGELFLREMLELRVDPETSSLAAEGWGGGIYRAWTDGEDVALVLRTSWDSAADARQFADALDEWSGSSDREFVDRRGRDVVDLVTATSAGAAADLQDALSSTKP